MGRDGLLEAAEAVARDSIDSERYRWLRENPAFETEAFLSGLTPTEFDAVVDARIEQDANWRPASAFGFTERV